MLGWSSGATAAAAACLAAAALAALLPCCTPVACSPAVFGPRTSPSPPGCFLKPHELQVWDRDPSLHSSVSCLRGGDIVGSPTRAGGGPPRSSMQGAPLPDQEEAGPRSLKDLGSNEWMAQRLHEYVQAKEAEKRRKAYLLPRRKRLPLANFSEDALVFGKVVSLLPFGCRVDVGCVDSLGLLHVRDMHFLPRALKAGAEYLRRAEALEAEPAGGDCLLPGASFSEATSGWIAHAGDVLKVGDALYLKIKSIDRDNRRMRLTTACTAGASDGDSPRKAIGTFWVGQEVEGTVLRATSFGLFLDIGAVEDAFLHVNELWRGEDTENVPQLYDKFRSSSRRSQRAGALSQVSPHVPGSAGGVDDPRDPTQFSSGDKMTGLRVLEVDAARNRIQLTTRSEAEVQRLLRWRQMAFGLQRDAQQEAEESEEEKVAKLRAALKLLERHRKKHQLLGSEAQPSTAQQQQQQQHEDTEGNKYACLFPGYSQADFDEALSLLEAEKRRKELLFLQAAERKARRRHPR
ncbi:hypothetical protein Esti_002990 [Eimeria stiedai]